mmetsp:Transcript_13523/g.13104  ORF Transcript_13523/g.13104 Transcript_13523/m.13104 type:complete len:176 (-) Transcript_13523:164-691(-)
MRLLNARIAEMNLFSPLESKNSTPKKDSTTNLLDVRSVKMPRNPVWRVDRLVVEEDVGVEMQEEEAAEVVVVVIPVEAVAHVTLSRKENVLEDLDVDLVTRAAEVEEVVVEEVEGVVVVEIPEGVEVVSVMPTKKANVQEDLPVGFLIKYLKLYHIYIRYLACFTLQQNFPVFYQ